MVLALAQKADHEQIFRPFYRTDEARDRESGGTGLGLAIVETAIQQHRGWVKAEDSPLGGLRLVIWLHLANGSGLLGRIRRLRRIRI